MTAPQVSAQGLRDRVAALQQDAEQTSDPSRRAQHLRDAAYLALDLGDATLAMTCAVACLDAARHTPDLALQARAHVTIALSMSNVHDDIGAAAHFREAEGLARSARDARGVALVSVNAAHHDLERGHYLSATLRLLGLLRSPYAPALSLHRELGMDQVFHMNFTRGAAAALMGQGADQAQHAGALRAQQQEIRSQLDVSARALRRLHAGEDPLANTLWHLDVLESLLTFTRFQEDVAAARELADQWVCRAEAWVLPAQRARALLGRAQLHAQAGDWVRAAQDARSAAGLAGEAQPTQALAARQLLAQALAAQEQWRAAFEVQQALSAQAEEIYRAFMQQSARLRVIERQAAEAEVRAAAFAEAALRDPLTGIPNRAGALRRLDQLCAAAQRGRAGAVALLDIDHFKSINDRFGHMVGDEVLRRVSAAVTRAIREMDQLARYGGEEFLLLLDSLTLPEARRACHRVGQLITDLDWSDLAPGLQVTVSIGLATVTAGQRRDEILREADAAMYAAKAAGRNTVRLAVTTPHTD